MQIEVNEKGAKSDSGVQYSPVQRKFIQFVLKVSKEMFEREGVLRNCDTYAL